MNKEPLLRINREISWLSFNERVLQEANDPTVPLIERLRFLGIFSNNRDEFFRVRVATLRRMLKIRHEAKNIIREDPKKLLNNILLKTSKQQALFTETYQSILKELELHNIFFINEKQLSAEQGQFVREYFHEFVFPAIVPIMLDQTPHFPWLKDRAIYLILKLSRPNKKTKYSLIEIPTDKISRFVVIPQENKYIILLDDVIRYCLNDIFYNFNYDKAEAFNIKLTRDAELDIEQDVTKSLVKKVSEGIKRRKSGEPVRLEHDEIIAPDILKFIYKRLKFLKNENFIGGGRYLNFVDFINFPNIGKSELKYKSFPALSHPDLNKNESILKVIRKKDILLTYPYQSFHHVIDVLREASIDPKVKSISITLYRVAKKSNIVNTLINAVKNGKQVTAVVELQARFDEEQNIYWSNRLQEEGAKVIYGVPGLKVHTKLFLISREENGQLVQYAHLGTGNFNEDTAKIYCDHSLLTCDKKITNDIAQIFNFYKDNYKIGQYSQLVVAPFYMRKKIVSQIKKEIKNAKEGKEAWMFLKMNSLVDEEIISALYEASHCGVKIRLIIRGICSLIPGVAGISENIEAISIIDKYLEHSRVFIFCNIGEARYFISSADMMSRNLDFRSEVAVPIFDKNIQKELKEILEIQWRDNIKARVINEKQDNIYRTTESKTKVRAQDEIYKFLKKEKVVLQTEKK
ncbi:MAG: polyphosphate kinase 1 [Bacteroidia bacterium]